MNHNPQKWVVTARSHGMIVEDDACYDPLAISAYVIIGENVPYRLAATTEAYLLHCSEEVAK